MSDKRRALAETFRNQIHKCDSQGVIVHSTIHPGSLRSGGVLQVGKFGLRIKGWSLFPLLSTLSDNNTRGHF